MRLSPSLKRLNEASSAQLSIPILEVRNMTASNNSSRAVMGAVIRESSNGGAPLHSLRSVHEALELSMGSYGMEEFGAAFAKPGGYVSKDIGMLWPAVADKFGDYQVLIAPQYHLGPPTPRARVPEVDAIHAAEAPLRRLLALASVVGLPREIERADATRMLKGFSLVT